MMSSGVRCVVEEDCNVFPPSSCVSLFQPRFLGFGPDCSSDDKQQQADTICAMEHRIDDAQIDDL